MTQTTPAGSGGSNVNNLMTTSSTPIRIGSGLSSYHGSSSASVATPHQAITGNESSSPGGGGSAGAGTTAAPQSSSVPSGAADNLRQQLQSQISLSMGASNQSLGVSAGAVGGTSITPPNSAGLRQTGGLASWATDSRDKYDGNQTDKISGDPSKLNRKESYKAQRKNYRREKKRVASELLNSLQDPTVVVLADWLKVRGTLKSWTKLWCVLKPGMMLLYKTPKLKSSHWVGTIMLTSCQVIERPSKKDGFCFKLFHPLEQSIWAPRGPEKETIGAVVQPLPTAYLIFRAPSQAAGKCWMDALELSLRCSALLLRSNSSMGAVQGTSANDSAQISHETQWSEADYEKHFNEHDLDGDSQNEGGPAAMSGVDTESESEPEAVVEEEPETPYVPLTEEEFGSVGEQVEELAEENKSLIWILVKQVRPGMDLSKVVLPTFILEPRSFLDKLSDSYYHADLLSRAVTEDDPFTRMKTVVQWYLSGFYKKPKGLKKPYNPILGETFRCYWEHPNGSRTFYIAEQVSHHPPVSAFYVTNRQDGFCISCSILAKSKFYGNSTSAVLEGVATLTLLPRGEKYTLNTPYAHCKGILVGTLSMELGGKVNIECENTGYKTELEFKLKPFLGGSDYTNLISGKIKLGKETMATINGHWDTEMTIKEAKTGEETILFKADPETKQKRLVRYVVPLDAQLPNESERLWEKVSLAIRSDDQVGATEEKTVLEEAQRNAAKDRKASFTDWIPVHFNYDPIVAQWEYRYADLRPWDQRNDVRQYEAKYKVLTKTRHRAPMVKHKSLSILGLTHDDDKSESSSNPDAGKTPHQTPGKTIRRLATAIEKMNHTLEEQTKQLRLIQTNLDRLHYNPRLMVPPSGRFSDMVPRTVPQTVVIKSMVYAFVGLAACFVMKWMFK
uniref:Oxysterol-binding protein n=1 Tax=Ceratitis capitata TaxID=7213 RepID=W8AJ47_CERCA